MAEKQAPVPDEIAEVTATREAASSKAKASLEAPGKPDRKPKASPVRRVPRKAIESAVGLANGILGALSPEDALSMGEAKPAGLSIDLSDEFKMLVDALESQQDESPFFRKYLARFCVFSGGVNILGVIGILLFVRLQRHGLIPNILSNSNPSAPEPEPAQPPTIVPAINGRYSAKVNPFEAQPVHWRPDGTPAYSEEDI